MNPSYIKGESYITVAFPDGVSATLQSAEPNYQAAINALKTQDWDEVRRLMIPAEEIERTLLSAGAVGDVRVDGGEVFYGNYPMHNTLTDRMLDMLREGFDITPLQLFLSNLMQNPSFRAVNELYSFLESSMLPITDDGHFLAYKRVSGDYKDLYTGKVDNSIGAVVKMPRNMVDEDKARTCSEGLHFCSREYLPHYGTRLGARTVIVKVNPRDVVAVPEEYNNAKARCCEYEVIDELVHQEEDEIEGLYTDTSTANDDDSRVAKLHGEDLETIIQIYDSPKAAADDEGLDVSAIRRVLRGDRKRTGGYGWAWYRDIAVDDGAQVPADVTKTLNDLADDLYDDESLEDESMQRW